MSQPAESVRVRRTRKLLREALIDLIEQKGFAKVTVAELTERAMISRAAFYRTHRDKYDLVARIHDEAMERLLGTVDDTTPPAERWAAFFDHIDAYHRFYAAMLGRKGSPWFAERMRTALAAMVTEHLPPGRDDLVPEVLGAMFAQSITWWLDAGRPVPAREIAATSARLAGAVLREAGGGATDGGAAGGGGAAEAAAGIGGEVGRAPAARRRQPPRR